jgi:hypothetical protein
MLQALVSDQLVRIEHQSRFISQVACEAAQHVNAIGISCASKLKALELFSIAGEYLHMMQVFCEASAMGLSSVGGGGVGGGPIDSDLVMDPITFEPYRQQCETSTYCRY